MAFNHERHSVHWHVPFEVFHGRTNYGYFNPTNTKMDQYFTEYQLENINCEMDTRLRKRSAQDDTKANKESSIRSLLEEVVRPDELFDVECILAKCWNEVTGDWECLVLWEGWDPSWANWELVDNVFGGHQQLNRLPDVTLMAEDNIDEILWDTQWGSNERSGVGDQQRDSDDNEHPRSMLDTPGDMSE
ncbi:hypothetical protein DFS34DRAFT_668375 [Phlyctochytrium arcticum]|nr:hypothetical protein DFS34DRAFT_668375 [Phlyctochytrium arcticum]